jgi:hypothetical protein
LRFTHHFTIASLIIDCRKMKNRASDGAVLSFSEEAFFIGPLTGKLAPSTGFEPVISALKGQRPNR